MPEGDLRVWWIPQLDCLPFHVPVASVAEAKLIHRTLARYDLFQLHHRIKPDYCNAGGLEVVDAGEWVEWSDEDTGDDICTVMRDEQP